MPLCAWVADGTDLRALRPELNDAWLPIEFMPERTLNRSPR